MAKRKKTPCYCAACGKQFRSPIAVQQHGAQKHPETLRLLDLVLSRPPDNLGIQPTTSQTVNAVHSTPSQRPPPNPAVRAPHNTTATIPGAPRMVYRPRGQISGADERLAELTKSQRRLTCSLCPNLAMFGDKRKLKEHSARCHPVIFKCTICSAMINNERAMKKHLYVEHRASWRWVKRLYGEPARPANNRQHNRQPDIPDYPSTGDYDDEGQLSSEDEEDPYLEDGSQPPPEDEQQPLPEGTGKQPAQNNWQSFGCDMCPETLPSEGTLAMHMQFAHCWRCGYCQDLPPFPSISLWREHRVVSHGLVE